MYVYFVRTKAHPQMMKIGKASDVERRIAELQTGCPYDLELIGSVRCKSDGHARAIERKAHRLFRHARTRGEWFNYNRPVHLAVMALMTVEPDLMHEATGRAFFEHRKSFREKRAARQRLGEVQRSLSDMDREFRQIVGGFSQ